MPRFSTPPERPRLFDASPRGSLRDSTRPGSLRAGSARRNPWRDRDATRRDPSRPLRAPTRPLRGPFATARAARRLVPRYHCSMLPTLPTLAAIDLETLRLDILGRLLMAVVLGGAIGLEREQKGKEAGLRTHILICLGAALFTIISVEMIDPAGNGPPGDVSRIAANVVTGVGFIGAGVILQSRGRVRGLTTAATIWTVAALGVATGAAQYVAAVGAAALMLVVLIPLRWWERRSREPEPED